MMDNRFETRFKPQSQIARCRVYLFFSNKVDSNIEENLKLIGVMKPRKNR